MLELLMKCLKWVMRGNSTDSIFKLIERLEERLDKTEIRLDECEKDRSAIKEEYYALKGRVDECEEDRTELRKMIASQNDKIESLEEKQGK